jgi:hypothetical protein
MIIFRKWGWLGLVPVLLALPMGLCLPAPWGDVAAGIVCAAAGIGVWLLGRRLNGRHPLRSVDDFFEAGLLERVRAGAPIWSHLREPGSDSSMFFVRVEYIGLLMVLIGFVTEVVRPFARELL